MPDNDQNTGEWPEVTLWAAQIESLSWNRPEDAHEIYLPLQSIRERLEAEADKLEMQNLEGDGPADPTAATVRAVKAQGIRDALAAAFPELPDAS